MTKLIDCKTVADNLGVSVATLSRMCSSGDIPHFVLRKGKRKRVIRFDPAAVERWLVTRTQSRRRIGNEVATQQAPSEQVTEQMPECQSENGNTHRSSSTVGGFSE